MSRLANSSSPYLLLHQHNPVDWYPWGPEAFAAARSRNVPIFLSIGYSTCYWCHVMERESFASAATAEVMNARFVNIKLDREQRPDVDEIYMAAVQMMTGSGGWPMSVFLEPTTLKPFWAGTYFPPVPAFGRPSFTQVLEHMADAYAKQHAEVHEQAETVAQAVREKLESVPPAKVVGSRQVQQAVEMLLTIYDRTNGGFGQAPKFPQPSYIDFLLEVAPVLDETTRAAAMAAVHHTLEAMATGGIHDQIGGGFHRYAVDTTWTVPHFEKMLYDNAQLLATYSRAAGQLAATPPAQQQPEHFLRHAQYQQVCANITQFCARELQVPAAHTDSPLCYTALDAEVDHREGLSYLWNDQELTEALSTVGLSPEDVQLARRIFSSDKGPNFQDPHHPADPPRLVLRLPEALRTLLPTLGLSLEQWMPRITRISAALLAHRQLRTQPRLDDKILPSLCGMMLTALATAAIHGHDAGSRTLQAASALAAKMQARLMRADGGLVRARRAGQSEGDGLLEDYAHFIAGLCALTRALQQDGASSNAHEAAGLTTCARTLLRVAEQEFADPLTGGYFDSRAGQADLFVRPRQTYDGAVPSSQSVMLHNLIDLWQLTGDSAFQARAIRLLSSLSGNIADSPVATINSTRALLRLLIADASAVTEALTAAAAHAGATSSTDQSVLPADLLQLFVNQELLELDDDAPGELLLKLDIAEGYHINSAFAQEQSGGTLAALRVGQRGGAKFMDAAGTSHDSGLAVYCDYPPGEPMHGSDAALTQLTVHRGSLHLRVALEKIGPLTGREEITLHYQLCSDTSCQLPVNVIVPVEIRDVSSPS